MLCLRVININTEMKWQLVFIITCVTSSSRVSTGHISDKYAKALEQYKSLCGPLTCSGNNTITLKKENLPSICQSCSCSPECLVTGTCCIDYFLNLPERQCIDGVVYRYASYSFDPFSSDKTNQYSMVKHCPSATKHELKEKCTSNNEVKSRITSLPVTSVETYLTYYNMYCAKCHNDDRILEPWVLDFNCSIKTDFNMISSFTEMFGVADQHNCTISTVQNNPSVYHETCSPVPPTVISTCNITGTWSYYDEAIDYACRNIDKIFGLFRNVFCYMCNPPIGEPVINETCLQESSFYESCISTPSIQASYPYKNIYSYLSHSNSTDEFVDDIMYLDKHSEPFLFDKYLVFSQLCQNGYKVGDLHAPFKNPNFDNYYYNPTVKIVSPWQYEIFCAQREVFSLFYTIKQLKDESMKRNCLFARNRFTTLSCFPIENLTRTCPNVTNGEMELVDTACRLVEDDKLLAYLGYYNIFCYICNNMWELLNFCDNDFGIYYGISLFHCESLDDLKEITTRSVICKLCSQYDPISGSGNNGYRAMFSLTSYEDSVIENAFPECLHNQIWDDKMEMCRNLTCSPGKVVVNSSCIPFLKKTQGLCYIFAVGINAIEHTNDIQGMQLLHAISESSLVYLAGHVFKNRVVSQKQYLFSNTPCRKTTSCLEGFLYLKMCTVGIVDRLLIEESLLQTRNATFASSWIGSMDITFMLDDNAFDIPVLIDKLQMTDRCIYEQTAKSEFQVAYRVDDLLLCTQLEFGPGEYLEENGQVTIQGYPIGKHDFMMVKDKIRVCAEYYSKWQLNANRENYKTLSFITTNICNMISILCLLASFVTYFLFRPLRTTPGINNMILVICLLLNMLIFQIRLFEIQDTLVCKIIGVLQHYFVLCTFTSFNICTYHVFRVFTSDVILQTKSRLYMFCKYSIYVFGFPALVVSCNILITYLVEDRQTIGYGGNMCFIILKTAVIATFLSPVGIILFLNLIMFAAAILHICRQPDISDDSSKKQKKNDVVIYFKLFTITGCTWIFQFVDAFFPETFFSILISICNMLTGVFIFMSYICNRRVYMLYQNAFKGKSGNYGTTSTTNAHTLHTTDGRKTTTSFKS